MSGELFVMPVISTMYETQSQFGKVEEGCLNESLLCECANFQGNLFTVMMSHVGVVTPTNEAMPNLSPLKFEVKILNSFVNMTRNINSANILWNFWESGLNALEFDPTVKSDDN